MKKISKIRTKLIRKHPFLGQLGLSLELVKRNDIETMAVDGRHLFYNEKFVELCSDDHLLGVISHEIGHVLFKHCGPEGAKRAGGYPQEQWTMAEEYMVNHLAIDIFGMSLPGNPYYDKKYNSPEWTTELICHDILADNKGKNRKGHLVDDHSLFGTVKISDTEINGQVASALISAKMRGNLPEGLERLVDDLLESKIPWTQELASFLCDICKDDFSMRQPNKKYLHFDFYVPSLYSQKLKIGVAFDSSGSITNDDFKEYASELKEILISFPSVEIHFFCCDAEVHEGSYAVLESYEDLDSVKFLGGGGTDFRPVFKFIQEKDIDLNALVYFTDTDGRFPDNPPEYDVLWVTTRGSVPWGHEIKLR